MNQYCLECSCVISHDVFNYSVRRFGIPLCRKHQDWAQEMTQYATNESLSLYFALKERGVPAKLELFDGYKHIDIAIPEAKVNLEIDGGHHNFNARQALADLKRTYHSFMKGYLTLRVPNSLVRNHLDEAADYIVDMLLENRDRMQYR